MVSSKIFSEMLLAAAMVLPVSFGFQLANVSPVMHRRLVVVHQSDPNSNVYSAESSQPVTPNQIKDLRKEASKRQGRKQLTQHFYVDDDNNDEGKIQDFLDSVCADLEEHELTQVRGVSRDDKRMIYETADQLAYDLSVEMQREVTIVQIKGHAVTLYTPSLDPDKQNIILRSNYQEGAWTPRVKAPRDHRGQIIKTN